ncbi:MAG: hypothetical protein LBB53_00575 [Prevotellaceae bacterium]|jgi:hypothetical protein|nr:hypothetical protein [Prevotellaceae bacterium]
MDEIQEEERKNRVATEYFSKFDCTKILGKIDFAVKPKRPKNAVDFEDEYLLWAEAKQKSTDILVMLAQLVLTIGKARTFDEILPPPFLGCYDNEKIAFVPYSEVQDIFYQNDFNWNVAPSNHDTKEFKQIYEQIKKIVENDIPWQTYLFYFERDDKELRRFIRENFIVGKTETSKIKIDKNNFIIIYNKWLEMVKPTINVNWKIAKKNGLIDGDFYLADLLSSENKTITEKLLVLLNTSHYIANRRFNEMGMFSTDTADFNDNQKAHAIFWAKYERPPKEDYWDYIIDRHDLLVPQDIRERKGSFFTPQIWVEKSQEYLAKVFGENWQDEYYIWDCCAGSGNLLVGLTEKYNLWASTLDKADVDVMHQRIEKGANLYGSHVFQFDFLNDDFTKLPKELQQIISDPAKRQKLVIYINPPYADASSGRRANAKAGNSFTKTYYKYKDKLSSFGRELFAQFIIRIYFEIPGCKIGEFSKLKLLTDTHAEKMRTHFLAKLEKMFIMPADTFDNVKGKFPIGFKIWDTEKKHKIAKIETDIFDYDVNNKGTKTIISYVSSKKINKWITEKKETFNGLGYISLGRNDLQHTDLTFIINEKSLATNYNYSINIDNLIKICVYFAVQKVITPTWLNDRDQFLYPNKKWEKDIEFQNDCLIYTLFNNNIQSKYGTNHWIPFTEKEVEAKNRFGSHFMVDFINGKLVQNNYSNLFEQTKMKMCIKREFSEMAKDVLNAGKELWTHYHRQPNVNENASLYDIREYFQGRNETGRMNNSSEDKKYNELIGILRDKLNILAKKIEPKVYEYEFLKK